MIDVDDVTRWLRHDGQHLPDLVTLVDGLLRRLSDGGAPIDRVAFGISLLHPHYRFHTMMWTPAEGVTDDQPLPFTWQSAPAYLDSPIHEVNRTGRPLRRRLVGPDARVDFPVLAELVAEGYAAYGALPVSTRGQTVAVVTFASRRADAFDDPRWSARRGLAGRRVDHRADARRAGRDRPDEHLRRPRDRRAGARRAHPAG